MLSIFEVIKLNCIHTTYVVTFFYRSIFQLFVSAYKHNRLDKVLLRHWSVYVPTVYTSTCGGDGAKDERKAQKFLFRPMEYFLCEGMELDELLPKLKAAEKPSHFCGKIFKMGEPTYNCR